VTQQSIQLCSMLDDFKTQLFITIIISSIFML